MELSERYDTLCVMIANEIQIQEIRSEIQGKIKERIDKNQRDYILREQVYKLSARNSARTIP